jgi:AbrB family looped-hinge helix DNA binding protein
MHTKVSIKGQVVIPAELREKYAIASGDTVDVRDGNGKIFILPVFKKDRHKELIERISLPTWLSTTRPVSRRRRHRHG